MKNFICAKCGSKAYFENVACMTCGSTLGFDSKALAMAALEPVEDSPGLFRRIRGGSGDLLTYCSNAAHAACNWLTLHSNPNTLCAACDLNRTIPNLTEPGSVEAWQKLERAKKRLVYDLLRYGLPLDASHLGKGRLTFDFVRNSTIGHLDGVITIDILETDAVERERRRQWFAEPFRTLLGHLRHESGHFYWMVLVEAANRLDDFRRLFGDERQDYGSALARHHAAGPPSDWNSRHVSAYASSHPWEDWAETWAHYLHMVSAVDTAESEGMEPRASGLIFGAIWPFKSFDVHRTGSLDALMERWIPLSIALNNLSRSMGHDDFYPFVIQGAAHDKLAFVHQVIRDSTTFHPPGN
ncbi:MAG: zinc-binding metallopeptidase family protein [Hyphomicrobium sp.]